jgi:hypothetical protein
MNTDPLPGAGGRPPSLRHLSSLNRRKILSKNAFAFLFALLTALSFCNLSSVMDGYLEEGRAEGRYEIADGTEYRFLYAEERLTGSRVSEIAEKYGELDLPAEIGRVAAADVRIVRMIAQVYGWDLAALASTGALSDERFYGDRAERIAELEGRSPAADDGSGHPAEAEAGAFGPAHPIELGYAEGWRNINAGMGNCLRIVLMIVFLALVPVFNEAGTLGVDNLLRSTRFGTEKLDRIRIVNALELSALIYASAVVVYVVPIAILYGLEGAALPIQSDSLYFLSPVNLSFFGQFAVNLLIGAVAAFGMAGLALLVSALIKDVFTGYATLLLSYLGDGFELSGFKHFLWNFSPAGMADFAAHYGHETYFGLPSVLFVPLVAAVVAAAEYSILLVLLRGRRA